MRTAHVANLPRHPHHQLRKPHGPESFRLASTQPMTPPSLTFPINSPRRYLLWPNCELSMTPLPPYSSGWTSSRSRRMSMIPLYGKPFENREAEA